MTRFGIGALEMVGHVELRDHLSDVVSRVGEGQTVAVTNRNRVEAYLIAPSELGRLVEAEDERDRIRSTLPLLIAALRNQVAFPAEALRSLVGSDLSLDWDRMNAFQAAFPTDMTHSEEGLPLPEFTGGLSHEPVSELADELHYV